MSTIPAAVRTAVEAALEERTGRVVAVATATPVSGGSINPAVRLETGAGDAFFLKWNPSAPDGIFEAEADGLRALAAATAATGAELRVPEVLAVDEAGPGAPWLLMEFVEPGRDDRAWGERLGRAVAALHRPSGEVGWPRDNFIGSLPQRNVPAGREWARFWAEARIGPQLRAARDRGHLEGPGGASLDALLERTPGILEGALEGGGASLLHGDLWGGNVFPDGRGRPVAVDPAVYRGHREVDLAMSELFGFPAGFLPAYREARPVDAGYGAFRRDLYQLYYLLVHVNLFGAGYEAGCVRAAERALAAV